MKLKNMFKKTRRNDTALRGHDRQPEVPDGLLRKCNVCKEAIFTDEVQNNDCICPKCGNYFRIPAYQRVEMIADEGVSKNGMKILWEIILCIMPDIQKSRRCCRKKLV